MADNYKSIINIMIQFKEEMKYVTKKRFSSLINLIQSYNVPDGNEYYENVPDNKELAEKLNTTYLRVNVLLKDLYKELMGEIKFRYIEIKECEHIVYISIPIHEQRKELKRKEHDFYNKFSSYIRVKLPVIPRVGEEIYFDFLGNDGRYKQGIVHSINHRFVGKKQQIIIDVHPYKNYYHQWKRLEYLYEHDIEMDKEYERR